MRERQPRMLVIWGKYDPSFDLSEPEAYRRDVPGAEVQVLDAGHFALDSAFPLTPRCFDAVSRVIYLIPCCP